MNLIILSDTHGLLRPAVLELLRSADTILHAGDINSQAIVDQLSSLAPLYVVRGNNDKEWAAAIPHKKDVPADLTGADVVVFGHSHKYSEERRGDVLWLNPGSCGPRRFHQEITLMRAQVTSGSIRVEKIVIPHEVP